MTALVTGLLSIFGLDPTATRAPATALDAPGALWGLFEALRRRSVGSSTAQLTAVSATSQAISVAAPVAGTPTVGNPDAKTGAVYGQTNFTDPAGQSLTYKVTGAPGKGSVTVWASGSYTYTPTAAARIAAGQAGAPASAKQDQFTITATNGQGSTPVTVSVPIGAVDQPVAGTPTVIQTSASTGTVYGNSGVVSQYGLAYTVTSGPTKGGVVVYSPAGGFLYTPTQAARLAAGAAGAPASAKVDQFTVTATNGVYSVTQTVTVAVAALVDIPAAGTPTVGNPDVKTGAVYGQTNFTDPAGQSLTYKVTGAPGKGSVTVWASGSYTYTPTAAARIAAGQAGAPASAKQDQFTITATNGQNSTALTVTVPIGAVDQPVAGTPTIIKATSSTGALYGNAGVTSQYGLAYTVTSGPTKGGVVVYSPAGGFTYTPTVAARTAAGDPNATASAKVDQFTVTATNGVYSTTQTVTVTISPIITTDGSVTAAGKYGWGTPNGSATFTSPASLQGWYVYDGPGNAGYGIRTPNAISFANNVMTITGDAQGTTGGMAAPLGQQYGMWEVRMKVPAGAPGYSPVLLLWPNAENWPTGGEIDFAEGTTDGTRQTVSGALHYSAQNLWEPAVVGVDATQWHNYAVEWTPTKITYYIDGVPWKSYTDMSQFPPGPMHLAIQLDVHTADLSQGATMQVAWAKQYSYSSISA